MTDHNQEPATTIDIPETASAVRDALDPFPRRSFGDRLPESSMLIGILVLLIIGFSWASPYFLTSRNLTNILTAVAVSGVLATAATVLMIGGHVDLSVGGGVALVGTVFAAVLAEGNPQLLALILAIGVGLAIGIVNGVFVTVVGITSLITTLGTMAVVRGLAQVLSNGQSIGFVGFQSLGIGSPLLGVPWAVWIFGLIVIVGMITMRYTVIGRSVYAIGSNSVAAMLTGIRVQRYVFMAFLLSGLVISLAGLILASQTGQGSGNAAIGMELSVITAVILGGASLNGGKGTIVGTLIGVLIIGVINNGLVLLNVQSFWQSVIRGGLLLLAVSLDQLRTRLR